MFKRCVSSVLTILLLNASTLSVSWGLGIFESSGNSSAQSSGNSSGNASEPSVSATVVIVVILALGVVGLAVWGISTTSGPGQPKADPQVEVSLLIDEAARMDGHSLDMLAKIYNLDRSVIAGIVMQGYLENSVSAVSPETASFSMDYLSRKLLEKSVEVNGCEPKVISSLKNDPVKIQKLIDAIAERKTPSEVFELVFAF